MNFWGSLPDPFTVLAPMEDVTDTVFRRVITYAGRPDVFMTEFTNSASFCNSKGIFSTEGRLTYSPAEKPIVAQIWGTVPAYFRQMAISLAERGFNGIDINMGCPVKDVVKTGAGSGLINNPQLATQLIQATKLAGLPVSVKTRLGDRQTDELESWLTRLLNQKLANLTVHLRTRKEMSKVPAHYELIPKLITLRDQISPSTKLTINGDIANYRQVIELKQKYPGVNGFMIGRGVFTSPYCFRKEPPLAGRSELIKLFRYHLDQYDQYHQILPDAKPELTRNFNSLKHFFKTYVRGHDGAAELRARLYACQTTDQVRYVLNSSQLND